MTATAAEPVPETTEALLGAVIALLAEAYEDGQRRKPLPPRRPLRIVTPAPAAWREMTPTAARLARAVAAGNRRGAASLLNRPRTRGEWKTLALILAAAADPERIAEQGRPVAAKSLRESAGRKATAALWASLRTPPVTPSGLWSTVSAPTTGTLTRSARTLSRSPRSSSRR